jgi:hypothetical protein
VMLEYEDNELIIQRYPRELLLSRKVAVAFSDYRSYCRAGNTGPSKPPSGGTDVRHRRSGDSKQGVRRASRRTSGRYCWIRLARAPRSPCRWYSRSSRRTSAWREAEVPCVLVRRGARERPACGAPDALLAVPTAALTDIGSPLTAALTGPDLPARQ